MSREKANIEQSRFARKLDWTNSKYIIQEAVAELRIRLRRRPSKKEILDHLFSTKRDDPEAKYLAKRLWRYLDHYSE